MFAVFESECAQCALTRSSDKTVFSGDRSRQLAAGANLNQECLTAA